ncbi:hypothetical protein LCGC14_1884540 [marine sediment metagenome]|uniref:Uncharacterized protein n=1 Tax=marine sediment metagenome TaxID=412755 RepID=A0A0F9GPN7_9ZZZZ
MREKIHDTLSNLRQRIELEDDDFHYAAVLETTDLILSLMEQAKREERERITKEIRQSKLLPQYSTIYKIIDGQALKEQNE